MKDDSNMRDAERAKEARKDAIWVTITCLLVVAMVIDSIMQLAEMMR